MTDTTGTTVLLGHASYKDVDGDALHFGLYADGDVVVMTNGVVCLPLAELTELVNKLNKGAEDADQ